MTGEPRAAIAEAFGELGLEREVDPRGGDWRAASELALDTDAVAELIRHGIDNLGAKREDVAGQQLVEAWSWPVAAFAGASILSDGSMPGVNGDNVLARGGAPGVMEIAFRQDERVEAPGEDLAHRLATTLANDHLAPLIETVNGLTGRPRRALWRGAGDRVSGAILWLGQVVGDQDLGERLATAALRAQTPFATELEIDRVDTGRGTEPVQIRSGCCIWYRSDDDTKCLTCPLLTADERRSQTIDWVSQRDGWQKS